MHERSRPHLVVLVAALAVAGALAGCEAGAETARGVVVAVDAPTATDVRGFTLRTNDGALLTFRVGRLELVGDAFPAAHLREHLRTLVPIIVVYRVENGERVAVRLADAPPDGP
ncbi:MAG TPA: hypothetical protein VNO86_05285 [Candidatus Binatia bacterium]|nr:hypothetical protein [Candidatus Binatia bacterium]